MPNAHDIRGHHHWTWAAAGSERAVVPRQQAAVLRWRLAARELRCRRERGAARAAWEAAERRRRRAETAPRLPSSYILRSLFLPVPSLLFSPPHHIHRTSTLSFLTLRLIPIRAFPGMNSLSMDLLLYSFIHLLLLSYSLVLLILLSSSLMLLSFSFAPLVLRSQLQSSSRQILVAVGVYSFPLAVRSSAERILPSSAGNTRLMRVSGHEPRDRFGSAISTRSPTCRFRWS